MLTKEEALKWIEETDKFAKENNYPMPPMLEFVQDMATAYGISFEHSATSLKTYLSLGTGKVRPIRKK